LDWGRSVLEGVEADEADDEPAAEIASAVAGLAIFFIESSV
jgi:hypothetical protein